MQRRSLSRESNEFSLHRKRRNMVRTLNSTENDGNSSSQDMSPWMPRKGSAILDQKEVEDIVNKNKKSKIELSGANFNLLNAIHK